MAPILPYTAGNSSTHARHPTSGGPAKPIILHLGDPIEYDLDLYARLNEQFHIIRPLRTSRNRPEFIEHLKAKTWGNFSAIIRPFWNTGNEMARWDRELIELLPETMKIMASAGAGYDWVDVDVLGEYGILYTNCAGASTESVADMALFHILSVFRQMTWTTLAARSGDTSQFAAAHADVPVASHNPRDHRLGIVGLGNIGHAIAKKVQAAFDMQINYFDIYRKSPEQEHEVSATFYKSLDDLLRVSDCILIATPAGRPLITSRTLALLPRGARVVNIARGNLVNEDDLADALESGQVSAAGLDVHMKEPRVSDRLRNKMNVTLTCHTGGGSVETIKGFERLTMQNVLAVLNGELPLTAVNEQSIRRRGNNEYTNGHTNGACLNGLPD